MVELIDSTAFFADRTRLPVTEFTPQDVQQAASFATPQPRSLGENIVSTLATILPVTLDITSASFGLTERGEVSDVILNHAPGLKAFVRDNQGALDAAASIPELVLSMTIAGRVTKAGTLISNLVRRIPGGRIIANLDRVKQQRIAVVARADTQIALNAELGIDQFVGRVSLSGVGGTRINTTRNVLAEKARRAGQLRGAVQGAVTEGVLGAIANENDFLYFDDAGTNLAIAAFGIALPAGIERIGVNFLLKKFVSSDIVNRVAAQTIDRGGFDLAADLPIAYRDVKTGEFTLAGTPGLIASGSGAATDRITALFLARDAKVTSAINPERVGTNVENIRRAALQDEARAIRELDRVIKKGIFGNVDTQAPLSGQAAPKGVTQHTLFFSRKDPTGFYGVEEVGIIPLDRTAESIVSTRTESIINRVGEVTDKLARGGLNKEETNLLSAELSRLRFKESLVPMLARNGEFVPFDETTKIAKEFKGTIVAEVSDELTVFSFSVQGIKGKPRTFGFSNQGKLILPKGKTINNLTFEETQGLYAAADQAADAVVKQKNPTITLSKKPSFFELDFSEEVLRRTNRQAQINYPKGLNEERAQIESLAQKIDIIKKKEAIVGADLMLRERLNLPRLTSAERGRSGTDLTPIDKLIDGVTDGNSIRRFTLQDIKQSLVEFKKVSDLLEFSDNEFDLLGNSFKLGKDTEGNVIDSFLVFKRNFDEGFFTRDFLQNRIANRQADIYASLTSQDAGVIVRELTNEILSLSDYPIAIQTSKLNDIQLAGRFGGNRPRQTGFQTTDFIAADIPPIIAAQRIADSVNRVMRDKFDRLIKAPVKLAGNKTPSAIWASLRSKQNESSKQLFNQFISARRGWELSGKVTSRNGFTRFFLKNTEQNRKLWFDAFGEKMPNGAKLKFLQDGSEVQVDSLAMDAVHSFTHVFDSLRAENNTILRANGLGEVGNVPFWVPPRDFNNKFVNFIVDPMGKTRLTVVGNTQAELNGLITKLRADSGSLLNKDGFILRTQKDIEEFNSIWERAMNGFEDPNIPVVQVGTKNKGGSLSPFVEFNAMEEAIQQALRQMTRVGRDTIETIFKPQILASKSRAATVRANKINRFGGGVDIQERNIHDFYLTTLLGRQPLNDKGSIVGRIFNTAELIIDDRLVAVDRVFRDINPFTGSRAARTQFERLAAKIEDKMPFRDVNDFIEQRFATKPPPEFRKLTGALNRFSAGLILRWGEIAHPVLNLTGMVNTMPAVIRQFTMRPGESVEIFTARVGANAHIYKLANGTAVATLDMPKIMARAGAKMLNKKSHPDWNHMIERGFATQEVAEFHKQLSAINSRADWVRILKGDPSGKSFIARKGIDGMLGLLSDSSENFSRTWSHFVGLEVADIAKITGQTNRNLFAHELANKNIANYNPLNRPEIFQGGVGAPIGLFQSYMFNYWQRLFRYLETRDFRNLALQTAMQGTFFGLVTIPGFRQANDLIMSLQDGETSLYDGIYSRLDRETADVLTAGVLSTLPKLFGAGDGISLFQRGDISPRIPVISGPIPILQIGSRFFGGLSRGFDQFLEGNPGTTAQELTEIAAGMVSNRPLSGLLEIFANSSTDRQGNVIASEVRTAMGVGSRLIGLRPLAETKQRQAFYANKKQNEIQLAQRARLNRSTRAAIRGGNFELLPNILEKYLMTGGDPAYFKSWFREAVLAAEFSRSERQLLDVINNADKMNQVLRLLDARTGE